MIGVDVRGRTPAWEKRGCSVYLEVKVYED